MCREALALAERTGSAYCMASVHGVLSMLARDEGEIAQAAALTRMTLSGFWEIGEQWNLAGGLEGAAAVMAAAGQVVDAVRLYGAAAAFREIIATPLTGCWLAEYESHLASVRSALDELVFLDAWREGRGTPLAQAVAQALEALEAIAGNQDITKTMDRSAEDAEVAREV